jgi:hypothetical protein
LEKGAGERTDIEPLPSAGKFDKSKTLSDSRSTLRTAAKSEKADALAAAGLKKDTANRCEKIAKIDESEFERVIASMQSGVA